MKKLALATIIIGISISLAGCNNATNSTTENNINEKLTVDQAKEIALQHANLTIDQVSFIRAESEIENVKEKYGLEKTVVPVKGCRNISKKDMVFNDRTPELTVDPETYKVTVDGEEITSKPAEKLPLTQLYSLF